MTSALAVKGLATVLLAFWAVAFAGLGLRAGDQRERLPLSLLALAAAALAMLETYLPSPRLVMVAACGLLALLSRAVPGARGTGASLRDGVVWALLPIAIGAAFGDHFLTARAMTESYEGTVLLKALLIPGVLGCANMVLLVNASTSLPERRRQLMVRFVRLAWILSVPWLAITVGDLTFIPHGVAASAMRDSALIIMFLAHITLSYLAIDAYDTAVERSSESAVGVGK